MAGLTDGHCGKDGTACADCSAGGKECKDGGCKFKETLKDPASGLTWQVTPAGVAMTGKAAGAHCESLNRILWSVNHPEA